MTIRRLLVVPWVIPLRAPLATARGPVTERRGFLVQLDADGGRHGIGEAAPHPAAAATAWRDTARALADAGAWLVGASLDHLDALLARAASLPGAAAAGLDVALHDLAARASGRSVAALLAEHPRPAVETSALIDGADAAAAAGRGFRCAKLKVGPDLPMTVERFAAAHAAAPSLRLRADANGAWDAATAVGAARALAPLGLDWLEQPVADPAALAVVRRDGAVRVAADESVTGPAAVHRLADAGAADVVVLKLVQVGGLAAARATAAAAVARDLDVTVTTALDTTLGTAAALHLAAALSTPPQPCGLATARLLAGDLVVPALGDGPTMTLPDGPGLGVAVDAAALARWRVAEDA